MMDCRRFAIIVLAAWLAGCSSSSPPPPPPKREVQTAPEPLDNDRRSRLRMELAAAYLERGQASTALEEINLALAADPNSAPAYNLRGLIYGSLGEPALAEESFKHAQKLQPGDADAMHNYGWFLCQQRRYADADAQFRQALAQRSYREPGRTLLAQGVCHARNGRWAEAEEVLVRAYEMDPSNTTVAVNLAEVLYRRADYERARFYIRRANSMPEWVSAQSLWLALRIEHKLGQTSQVQSLGTQLRNRFPQAPETLLYERGRFDE
jgi:type IV pilus assembly protein PilF